MSLSPQLSTYNLVDSHLGHPNESKLQFYLNYHRTNLTMYHYHLPFDLEFPCSQLLFELAQHSKSLPYAMAALAARVYSQEKGCPRVEEDQLIFYTYAVSSLQNYLKNEAKPLFEMVAPTALVLATVDV